MKTIRVIRQRFWRNKQTGATASVHGSVPWTSEADKQNWAYEAGGFTWETVDSFGNLRIGLGRQAAETYADAAAVAQKFAERLGYTFLAEEAAPSPLDVYKQNGFANRKAYLESLCEEYDRQKVFMLANLLGPNEDFDGLVTALEDDADGY